MHIPVLKEEVLEILNPKENETFVDCTAGEGGHTFSIIEKSENRAKVISIDKDPRNIELIINKAKKLNQSKNVIAVTGNYADLKKIVEKNKIEKVSGIIFDLGISSWHIDESGRGFSFKRDEPLDMRYFPEQEITAWEIVNSWPREEIETILRDYGEEGFARQISKAIVVERKKKKINTSIELSKIIESVSPRWYLKAKIHCATKTFQALRIAVNQELDNLEKVLPDAVGLLEKGGRLAVISFHSLEDRIVKNFFKEKSNEEFLKILTKKIIVPSREEVINNSRSRSAKLRASIKIK